jgi:aminopeptidase N
MIDYRGNPNTVGRFGSGMFFRSHAGVPIVATLSEPYGSPTWWPCIDNPADKTTADMEITVPTGYVAVSNGLLQGVITNADSSRTYIWREQYPIANYLIAVTATNFAEFGDSYPALDGSTMMPLTYYVYPEHLDCARQNFPVTKEALRILAPLFGEYPFLKEQYGMVEFPWGGAMEHQTMTSMGESVVRSGCSSPTSGQSIIVHELAHQWWGDLVTMRTWNDIWLNEGFATYSEVLFKEKYSGMTPGEAIQRYAAGEGTVYAENAADPFDDQLAIYNKGGWVLHMLRRVMGDEAFFKALKEYGRRFAYSNAGTKDFQKVCSEIYGQPLDWFFDQWIYAPSRPIYSLTTTVSANFGGTYSIRLRLEQKQTHLIPNRKQSEQQVYIMPIDFTIHYADGTSEVKTVRNDRRQQDFTFTGGKRPRIETPVVMDEGNWLLKEIRNN